MLKPVMASRRVFQWMGAPCGPLVGDACIDWRRNVEQLAAASQQFAASRVGQEAVVPEPHEARWQDVQQEAPHELVAGEGKVSRDRRLSCRRFLQAKVTVTSS